MTNNRNMFIAIGLSLAILLGWQYFFGIPQAEKQRQLAEQQRQAQQAQTQAQPGSSTPPSTPAVSKAGPAFPAAPRPRVLPGP